MGSLIYQWMDLVWLPIILFVVHKRHRLVALGFVASCMFMLRIEIEFFTAIGFPRGVFNILNHSLYERGLIVYSLTYAIYLLIAHSSPGSKPVIFMAASISMFFFAFILSLIAMVL